MGKINRYQTTTKQDKVQTSRRNSGIYSIIKNAVVAGIIFQATLLFIDMPLSNSELETHNNSVSMFNMTCSSLCPRAPKTWIELMHRLKI